MRIAHACSPAGEGATEATYGISENVVLDVGVNVGLTSQGRTLNPEH